MLELNNSESLPLKIKQIIMENIIKNWKYLDLALIDHGSELFK